MSSASNKAVATASVNLYNRYFEYARVVTHVEVTDEGIYQVGEVPDSYGGAQLTLQDVNAVFMVNSRAEMLMLEFAPQPPMDKDRKTGGKIVRDGVTVREAIGPSSTDVKQNTVVNGYLDSTRRALGAAAMSQFKRDLADHPNQTPS